MATTSETGHLRNVYNFERLLAAATAYGADYNPSKNSLALPAMQQLLADSKESLDALKLAVSNHDTAIDQRKKAFATLNPFITRIYNALKASDSAVEADQSAAILVRKLRGQRVSARLTPEELEVLKAKGKEVNQKSSSQLGFDTRLDNFDKLVCLLSTIPEYNPNEPELKVEGLKSFYNGLLAKNAGVVEAHAKLNVARTHRDNLLYKSLSGMVDLAQDVKMYMKSVSGSGSVRYKQISKLAFHTYAN